MSTHTPGPWTHEADVIGISVSTVDENGRHVCTMARNRHVRPDRRFRSTFECDTQDEANARLIAAAPELLAALLKVLPLAETYLRTVPGTADHETAATIAAARAAIAKAEGTS